jgi:hypothetical protein
VSEVVQVAFPISERLLDEAVLRAVRRWWVWGSQQGLSLAQTAFYVEQDLDRPVELEPVRKALERLVEAGELSREGRIFPASSVDMNTGEESRGRTVLDRYFPARADEA